MTHLPHSDAICRRNRRRCHHQPHQCKPGRIRARQIHRKDKKSPRHRGHRRQKGPRVLGRLLGPLPDMRLKHHRKQRCEREHRHSGRILNPSGRQRLQHRRNNKQPSPNQHRLLHRIQIQPSSPPGHPHNTRSNCKHPQQHRFAPQRTQPQSRARSRRQIRPDPARRPQERQQHQSADWQPLRSHRTPVRKLPHIIP